MCTRRWCSKFLCEQMRQAVILNGSSSISKFLHAPCILLQDRDHVTIQHWSTTSRWAKDALSSHQINTEIECNWILPACSCVDVNICALTVPPMRKSSPATYCMRSCCWQHPSTPMIQPKRMMDTAMPTKPAVILLRSANGEENKSELWPTRAEWWNWRLL